MTGSTALLIHPALSAFPAVAGRSACATSFSRIAQRLLTLRPAHSPSHLMTLYTRGFSHFVTSMTAPIASGWSKIAGWDSHPLRNAAFARRTPHSDIPLVPVKGGSAAYSCRSQPATRYSFFHNVSNRWKVKPANFPNRISMNTYFRPIDKRLPSSYPDNQWLSPEMTVAHKEVLKGCIHERKTNP